MCVMLHSLLDIFRLMCHKSTSKITFVHAINTIRRDVTELVQEVLSYRPTKPGDDTAIQYHWPDALKHGSQDDIGFDEVLIEPLDSTPLPQSSAAIIQRESKHFKSLQSFFVKSELAMGRSNRPHEPIVD